MRKSVEENASDQIQTLKNDKLELQDQVKSLEAAVYLLQDEKEKLIENFQTSTNILIERIKKLEEQVHGQRPQTAQLLKNISKMGSMNGSMIEGEKNESFIFQKQNKVEDLVICYNCQKHFTTQAIRSHTIVCYRYSLQKKRAQFLEIQQSAKNAAST